jgi:hypothetical protein
MSTQDLQFPDEVYERIDEYSEQKTPVSALSLSAKAGSGLAHPPPAP